jgi:hypothetical protein
VIAEMRALAAMGVILPWLFSDLAFDGSALRLAQGAQ